MRRLLVRRWLILTAALIAAASLIAVAVVSRPTDTPVDLTSVISRVRSGEVERVSVSEDGRSAEIQFADQSKSTITLPPGQPFTSLLTDAGISSEQWPPIEIASGSGLSANFSLLLKVLTFAIIGGMIFFLFRRFSPGGIGSGSSRRGGYNPIRGTERPITFADVAGCDEVKEEVRDIVEFLRDPDRFRQMGARIPRGLLLSGHPGTGKTLLARALAGEANTSFFSVSGSEFVELYVGVGASRVRELFRRAKESAPSIIFIDEIDAIGRRRGRVEQSSEYDQTLNQILVEMDGFEERTTVVVIAATNRADILDAALLRPGRFDRKVMVDLPDKTARLAILEVHGRGKPFGPDVNLAEIAARTVGMSGADLSNVINEAAILAARNREKSITMSHLYEALDRTIAGPARNARRFSERERKVIAYHEAGHAVVAHVLPHADRVRKVSIVSRGHAGGFTMIVPDEDRGLWTRNQLNDRLAALLGGLAAEETIFGDITTGSSNDLEQTTAIASSMVQRYGMSRRFGLYSVGNGEGSLSPQNAFAAEQEALQIVGTAHETAQAVLRAHREDLERVAQRLLEAETIEGDELAGLIGEPATVPVPVFKPVVDLPTVGTPTRVQPARRGRIRRVGRAASLVAAFSRAVLTATVRQHNPHATDQM